MQMSEKTGQGCLEVQLPMGGRSSMWDGKWGDQGCIRMDSTKNTRKVY